MLEVQRLAAAAVAGVVAGRNLDDILRTTWQRASNLAPADRAAIQDLSFGAVRHLGWLQAALDRLLQKPITDPMLAALLWVALYQLQFSKAKPYAVVDHAVTLTAQRL